MSSWQPVKRTNAYHPISPCRKKGGTSQSYLEPHALLREPSFKVCRVGIVNDIGRGINPVRTSESRHWYCRLIKLLFFVVRIERKATLEQ